MTGACEVALRAAETLFFAGERLTACALDALAQGAAAVTIQAESSLSGKLEGLVGDIQAIMAPGDIAFCPADAVALTVEPTGLAVRLEAFNWNDAYRSWGGPPELRSDVSERCIVLLIRNGGILDPSIIGQRLRQCAFLSAALIPASLSPPALLDVRVGLHRQRLNRLVSPPKAQWMHDGELIGLVQVPVQHRRLVLNRFTAEGQDDTVAIDFGRAYDLVGVPAASSYGVKTVTHHQFEVVGLGRSSNARS